MMSDIPWAVAWYGQRQCAWLTLNYDKDFFAINDFRKPVQTIYITYVPAEEKILTIRKWLMAGTQGWGNFLVGCGLNKGAPGGFPIKYLQPSWPDQFLLTTRDRPVKMSQ